MCLTACGPSPSRRSFANRGEKYFSQIAEQCDSLMKTTLAETPQGRKFSGGDPALPTLLKDLHPTYVLVNTNGVLIMIGAGRAGFGVTWYSRGSGEPAVWHLETIAEGDRRIIFSK